jgi:hypothetical protein
MKIYKNKILGVYKVGDYKIGDRVKFKYEDGESDEFKIEGFSDDGREVYGVFWSDDCGGFIEFDWIVGFVKD